MYFRSAMCSICDCIMKIDSSSETMFCSGCGNRHDAEGAFIYYDLKHADSFDADTVNSVSMFVKSGRTLLDQGKYDQADLCFQKAIELTPEDYYLWKLRAFTLESKVVNELRQSFYTYNKKTNGLVEAKEHLDQYKELCHTAVKLSPSDISDELAEEFNDRIREHFNIAMKAYMKARKRYRTIVITAALVLFLIIAIGFKACQT